MAKTKISEFSSTPSENTDIDSINIAEGCAPSGINNAIRELMAQLKDFQTGAVGDSFNGPIGSTTPSAGAFTTLSASGAFTYGGVTLSNAVTGTGNMVLSNSPTLVTPALGTPSALVGTNITGTAAGLSIGGNAATATTSTNVSGGTASVTTLTTSSTVTHNGGTANGVAYLNGSKVLTTGSALTFDGTNLGVGASPTFFGGQVATAGSIAITGGSLLKLWNTGGTGVGGISSPGTDTLSFSVGSGFSEQMRLTSTGLGIGTSSPGAKLDVYGSDPRIQSYNSSGPKNILLAGGTVGYTGMTTNHPLAFITNDTERARIDSSGNLLVGTTSNSSFAGKAVFVVNGSSDNGVCVQVTNASGGSALTFFNSSAASVGSITTTASATAYNTSSDYRLKNITGPITTSGAYIDSLNPVEGTWKADGSTFVGLIAHEVQEASRTQVATGVKDGEQMQGMDYSSAEIIANLIAEVKSLRQRLAAAGI